MEKTVVLKSKGKNMQFRLPIASIMRKEITEEIQRSDNDIIEEVDLPVQIITKLVMQLKLSTGSIFSAPKPINPENPFEGLIPSTADMIKEILKEEIYVKSLVQLYEKYELTSMKDFIGFLLAVHLKDKTAKEINEFFGLEEDLTNEEIEEIKNIMDILETNV
jgi:hypothetical protein